VSVVEIITPAAAAVNVASVLVLLLLLAIIIVVIVLVVYYRRQNMNCPLCRYCLLHTLCLLVNIYLHYTYTVLLAGGTCSVTTLSILHLLVCNFDYQKILLKNIVIY